MWRALNKHKINTTAMGSEKCPWPLKTNDHFIDNIANWSTPQCLGNNGVAAVGLLGFDMTDAVGQTVTISALRSSETSWWGYNGSSATAGACLIIVLDACLLLHYSRSWDHSLRSIWRPWSTTMSRVDQGITELNLACPGLAHVHIHVILRLT